ncbi:unnamed protein product [Cylicocyclus nassatus]|uniref:site-specific DNA-methyltransferase (adenine-specific) n=1 Tax=Cylicocyclus nassatus TaxID=53992 RepID=A0AA36GYY2_CYLNA|nr:unnamed protein product [Cylicocyclus nassatus]
MIWAVADALVGPFKAHEYGLVILPMTVVKRFHDCLLPTHQAVLDTYDKSLLTDPENIEANFRDYLAGFSANAQDVLAKFEFDNIIKRMSYLGPDKISAVDCGYIFEDLVRRFSESYGEEAGAHFTSRDIIYMMTDLLLSDADLSEGGSVTVYDMTMGTSQMLSCMERAYS